MSNTEDSGTAKESGGLGVFERYTDEARRAILYAWHECRRRGDSVVSTADLLAGLSREDSSRAQRVGSLKENAFYLRWLAGLPPLPSQREATIPDAAGKEGEAKLDDEAKQALAYAVLEADRDREYWVDSDHLLRGILRFPNRAHFAVLKTEINLSSARTASHRDRKQFVPQQKTNSKVMQYLIRRSIAPWIASVVGLMCFLYLLLQSFGSVIPSIAR